mmetsp:Transcript_35749/g.63765  ORF Transcript_35749/g.63765 Transcript_35749/m.63765 type:complete len:200 (+) Transcript_35749:2166-2765(+)
MVRPGVGNKRLTCVRGVHEKGGAVHGRHTDHGATMCRRLARLDRPSNGHGGAAVGGPDAKALEAVRRGAVLGAPQPHRLVKAAGHQHVTLRTPCQTRHRVGVPFQHTQRLPQVLPVLIAPDANLVVRCASRKHAVALVLDDRLKHRRPHIGKAPQRRHVKVLVLLLERIGLRGCAVGLVAFVPLSLRVRLQLRLRLPML